MANVVASVSRVASILSRSTATRCLPLAAQSQRTLFVCRVTPVHYFTKKHEYVDVSEDKTTGTVGITHYAQEALGDVVYAQLPEADTSVEAGNECGALESVKAASEIYSPVSGTVLEKNASVEDMPALINQSAEDKGWLFKVKLSSPDELDSLMDKASYEAYLKTQEDDH